MSGYIDELFIKIGLDPGELKQGLLQVQMVIESVESEAKSFGEGLAEGLSAAETQADQAGAAVAGLGVEARKTEEELRKAGKEGKEGLTQVKEEARKTGKELSDLDKKAERLSQSLGKKMGKGFSRFLMGLAAPVLGLMAAGGIIKKYTDDMEKLEELSKKRNLSLKEREERQKLLKEYSAKDLENYRQTKKATEAAREAVGRLGGELMKFAGPYVRGALEQLRVFAEFLDRNHRFVKILAGVIGAALIPVLWGLAAAFLANPLTWIIAGLVALAAVLEDLWVYLNGGESALAGFWESLGLGEGTLESLKAAFEALGPIIESFKAAVSNIWNAVKGPLEHVAIFVGQTLKEAFVVLWNFVAGILDLMAGDIDGAVEHFKGAFKTGIEAVKRIFGDLRDAAVAIFAPVGEFIKGVFDGIVNAIRQKIAGLIDMIPDFLKPESLKSWADDINGAVSNAVSAISPSADLAAAMLSPGAAAGSVDNSRRTEVDSTVNNYIYPMNSDPAAIGAAAGDAVRNTMAHTFNSGVNH